MTTKDETASDRKREAAQKLSSMSADDLELIDSIFNPPAEGEDVSVCFRTEKRRAVRMPTLLPGFLLVGPAASHRCIIRDLSATGARVSVSRKAKLQNEMRLFIETKGGRRVRPVWRKGEALGLEFI